VVKAASGQGEKVHALSSVEFAVSNLRLDLVVCAAVLDVVVPRTRVEVIRSATRNLAGSGLLIVIVPRNDSTILRRCSSKNAYCDGHVFPHHGVHTFYHNFRDHSPIVKICIDAGLGLEKDLSSYRQICLILSVSKAKKRLGELSKAPVFHGL
jgi:hypothetical protein